MKCAITIRYMDTGRDNKFRFRYYIPKAFLDIANKLNIKLFPVVNKDMVEFASEICDALILTGSNVDIDPSYYGEEHDEDDYFEPVDEFALDKALIEAFKDKPILGICGGVQAMNVAYNGSIHRIVNHGNTIHKVYAEGNAVSLYNKNSLMVNSHHHWCIDRLGTGLKKAFITEDGVIEGIISIDETKLGVQWHPELMSEDDWKPLFDWLEKEVKEVAKSGC